LPGLIVVLWMMAILAAARSGPLTERVPLRQRRMLAGSLICGLRESRALPGVASLGPPPEFR
jgi:hypothetical protein